MHHVERGPAPVGLRSIRRRYTPRWVRYYREDRGSRPTDSRWREFQPDLSNAFGGICGYCEECCKGEVDHFRPKGRNPELTYEWTNWVLACHTCNHKKHEKWPPGGYVDPCARSRAARPETYFEFDTMTGEMLPREGLSANRRRKALQTIDDLGLNSYYHLKKRQQWLTAVSKALDDPNPERDDFVQYVSDRRQELSSITRQFLRELRQTPALS